LTKRIVFIVIDKVVDISTIARRRKYCM